MILRGDFLKGYSIKKWGGGVFDFAKVGIP